MAPVIRISDEVFRKLQSLGEPFVDTPSTVIERVLEYYETTRGNALAKVVTPPVDVTGREPDEADRCLACFLGHRQLAVAL